MGARRRRVVWSTGAAQELDDATAYIARDSISSAVRVLERLLAAAESLADLSERRTIVPEHDDPNVRELFVNPYRLIYSTLDPDEVTILGVLHQRRDYSRWSEGRRDEV